MLVSSDFVVSNSILTLDDKDLVGIELASLGEISKRGDAIISTSIITPYAFAKFLTDNNLSVQIMHLLGGINHERHDSLAQISSYISGLIQHGVFPKKIVDVLFKHMGNFATKEVSLCAYYFQGRKLIGRNVWNDLSGEAVLIEHLRIAWAHLFSPEYLKRNTIHSKNHKNFSVCLAVIPQLKFSLTGTIRTAGKTKSEYEIEAHSMVKFTYNKHSKQLQEGNILAGGNKDALSVQDIKTLLHYAIATEKALYIPQVLTWGKYGNTFFITDIAPISDVIEYKDTYSLLSKNLSVHPGITIGRLKVINEKTKEVIVAKDEIVMLKKLDRPMINAIKGAKGLIIEEEPHPEVTFLLKNFGIPTLVRKKHQMLYSTGDVISLNATTGEIKRGSMLVS